MHSKHWHKRWYVYTIIFFYVLPTNCFNKGVNYSFDDTFNLAYWEKCSLIEKIQFPKSMLEDASENAPEMILNTEWGSFGDRNPDYLPRTLYDNRVNRESVNPGVHIFEKMVSGLYLGEIARNVILDFVDRRLLFDNADLDELNVPYSFEASYMSTIESDTTPELDDVKHIVESIMNVSSTTREDREIVKRICELVGQRAARLVAAAISAVIEKRGALELGLTISKFFFLCRYIHNDYIRKRYENRRRGKHL